MTLDQLKEILIEEYILYYNKYDKNVLKYLALQGKKNIASRIEVGQATLPSIIISDDYYLSNLDIWIIANKLEIPIILYSGTTLKENNEDLLILFSNLSQSFNFIKSPGVKIDTIPLFKLLVDKDGNSLINIESLSEPLSNSIKEKISENYLDNYLSESIKNKSKPKLKIKETLAPKTPKKKKLILEEA